MAITQLHGILFANQNMQIAASKQIDLQGRVEFQNLVAAAATNDKQRLIDETRAAEESKGLEPEREHNRKRAEDETSQRDEPHKKQQPKEKQEEDIPRILDIKA